MRQFAIIAAATLLAAPAIAAPVHWSTDYAKSKFGFTVQWGGEPFVATFKSWKADIAFDPADLAHSKAVVTINIASETSDDPDNDQGLKGPQGFNASQFATATATFTKFTHGQGDAYVANGTLNLHGITKPVTLPFTLSINGKAAHMVGKTTLMRPDFGLAGGEFAGETPIAHAVTVNIDLTASKP